MPPARALVVGLFIIIAVPVCPGAAPGEAAPRDVAVLDLVDLEGRPRSLGDHRGRVVVLNFWATWCVPCREEMPIFVEMDRLYRDRGVVVIAASADAPGSGEAIQAFAAGMDLSFPVWTGATVEDMDRLGLGSALPATAILDAEGRIAFRLLGLVTRQGIEERLDHLLGGGEGEPPARLVDAFEAEGQGHDDHEGHDDHGEPHAHAEEEEHGHGGVGMEGASLVPS